MPSSPHRREIILSAIASLLGSAIPLAAQQAAVPQSPAQNPLPFKDPTRNLLHTTILITTVNARNETSKGTGFIFSFFSFEGRGLLALVTNKHVIADAERGSLVFTLKKANGEPDFGNTTSVNFDSFKNQWVMHPDDSVDLAILPLEPTFSNLRAQNKDPIYSFSDANSVLKEGDLKVLSPIQDVVIIGYPDGMSDTINNVPVIRRGITATPAYLDFDGRKEFLVDASIFPGSSGSPVFLYDHGTIFSQGTVSFGVKIALLGTIYGVAQDTLKGEIRIVPAPTSLRGLTITGTPNNVGFCIEASKILDFEPLLVSAGIKPPQGYEMRSKQRY